MFSILDDGRQILGHCASVSLPALSRRGEGTHELAQHVLSSREYAAWLECRSARRRVELLGGRIAAKLAVKAAYACVEKVPVSIRSMSILALSTGHRMAVVPGFGLVPVSISHTRQRAIAVAATVGHRLPAVDIVQESTRVRPTTDFFHESEIDQVTDAAVSRKRWMLKETAGKLLGVGLSPGTHGMLTVRTEEGGLGVEFPSCPAVEPLLAANDSMAIGFLEITR